MLSQIARPPLGFTLALLFVPQASETVTEMLGRGGVTVIKETVAPSLNTKICLASSVKGGGRGLFAKERIAKDEVVWREVETFQCKPRSMEFVMALPEAARKNFLHFAYCTCRPPVRCIRTLAEPPLPPPIEHLFVWLYVLLLLLRWISSPV